jgi:hypothetical protein
MAERVFEPKTVVLVANVAQSITWGVADFFKFWGDGIVYGNVSVRIRVENTAANAVLLSLNYKTRYAVIPFNERKNIASVVANATIELSKATVPTIGALKDAIESITLTLICGVAGTVRVTLIISDTDELAASGGNALEDGSSAASLESGYIVVGGSAGGSFVPGVTSATMYTVPAGKRFVLDTYALNIEPSPSYPGLVQVIARVFVAAINSDVYVYSRDDQYVTLLPFQGITTPLESGDSVRYIVTNSDATNHTVLFNFMGREIF